MLKSNNFGGGILVVLWLIIACFAMMMISMEGTFVEARGGRNIIRSLVKKCTSWGDPHLRPFSARGFDYYSVGEYTFAESADKSLIMQVRTSRLYHVSGNTAFVFKFDGETTIELQAQCNCFKLNGNPIDIPVNNNPLQLTSKGTTFTRSQQYFGIFRTANGAMIMYSFFSREGIKYLDLSIDVPYNVKFTNGFCLGSNKGAITDNLFSEPLEKTKTIKSSSVNNKLFNKVTDAQQKKAEDTCKKYGVDPKLHPNDYSSCVIDALIDPKSASKFAKSIANMQKKETKSRTEVAKDVITTMDKKDLVKLVAKTVVAEEKKKVANQQSTKAAPSTKSVSKTIKALSFDNLVKTLDKIIDNKKVTLKTIKTTKKKQEKKEGTSASTKVSESKSEKQPTTPKVTSNKFEEVKKINEANSPVKRIIKTKSVDDKPNKVEKKTKKVEQSEKVPGKRISMNDTTFRKGKKSDSERKPKKSSSKNDGSSLNSSKKKAKKSDKKKSDNVEDQTSKPKKEKKSKKTDTISSQSMDSKPVSEKSSKTIKFEEKPKGKSDGFVIPKKKENTSSSKKSKKQSTKNASSQSNSSKKDGTSHSSSKKKSKKASEDQEPKKTSTIKVASVSSDSIDSKPVEKKKSKKSTVKKSNDDSESKPKKSSSKNDGSSLNSSKKKAKKSDNVENVDQEEKPKTKSKKTDKKKPKKDEELSETTEKKKSSKKDEANKDKPKKKSSEKSKKSKVKSEETSMKTSSKNDGSSVDSSESKKKRTKKVKESKDEEDTPKKKSSKNDDSSESPKKGKSSKSKKNTDEDDQSANVRIPLRRSTVEQSSPKSSSSSEIKPKKKTKKTILQRNEDAESPKVQQTNRSKQSSSSKKESNDEESHVRIPMRKSRKNKKNNSPTQLDQPKANAASTIESSPLSVISPIDKNPSTESERKRGSKKTKKISEDDQSANVRIPLRRTSPKSDSTSQQIEETTSSRRGRESTSAETTPASEHVPSNMQMVESEKPNSSRVSKDKKSNRTGNVQKDKKKASSRFNGIERNPRPVERSPQQNVNQSIKAIINVPPAAPKQRKCGPSTVSHTSPNKKLLTQLAKLKKRNEELSRNLKQVTRFNHQQSAWNKKMSQSLRSEHESKDRLKHYLQKLRMELSEVEKTNQLQLQQQPTTVSNDNQQSIVLNVVGSHNLQ